MSREANEIARKLIQEWEQATDTNLDAGRRDDLRKRITRDLDASWQCGMNDAKLEPLLAKVRAEVGI